MAVPMTVSIGAVLRAQQLPKRSEERQYWMRQHESFGVLTAVVLVPRLAYRVVAARSAYSNVVDLPPALLPKHPAVEKIATRVAYAGLHGIAFALSVTGVAMNYYGGWGLPFFWTTIPGVPKTNENKHKYGAFTYRCYDVHKQVGYYGKYLVPAHVAGTLAHMWKGHAIMARINPLLAAGRRGGGGV